MKPTAADLVGKNDRVHPPPPSVAAPQTGAGQPSGTLRYWAAAREAAGTDAEPYLATTLAEALDTAAERHGPRLARVLAVSSYLVDSAPVGRRPHEQVTLTDGGCVEVLPPFAGG